MTPEQVADASAELIARIALLLDRRRALSIGELLPIVEAFTGPSDNPALPAMARRVSERLRAIEGAPNRRSARGVLDAQDAFAHTQTPWQSHSSS
jgi:hypothetical protein